MEWKTWTKISGVILFLIAVTGFYLANFHSEGVVLTIEDFPDNLDSLDSTEEITFSFYIYNSGDETAFVKSIILQRDYADASQVADTAQIDPPSDFSLEPGQSKLISITLPPQENAYSLTAEIYYDDEKLSSNTISVAWGTLL